ncbi:hypothetical protein [Dyella sp.]|uniref:hypothetical protein n=1 Tax=Dyella sp. TaxID=1869338 RepID=UPI002FDAA25D
MIFSSTLAPLAVCAVRDAVLYHERLLQSETLRNRTDYEEYAVDLSVFLDEITHRYKKIEASLSLPLDDFFESDVPTLAYRVEDSGKAATAMEISDPYALLMVSSVRDAILYRESLLRDQTSQKDLEDAEAYLIHLEKLLEFVKTEYKKIESKVGVPLERILHSE